GGLWCALLRREIDVHNAEPFGVAFTPFEVVEDRPEIVPSQGQSLRRRAVQSLQRFAHVAESRKVFHATVLVHLVRVTAAVLRDVKIQRTIYFVSETDRPVCRFWSD